MATTIITKQHDTKITFADKPTIDGVQMTLASLSGCTLSFLLKSTDSPPTKQIKQTASIGADPSAPTLGYFTYNPIASDVDTAMKYQQEWELVFPTGKILTFPNNGYNVVKILADLG
jgi:hypothetical protein